jgi:hypothetical protein
MAKYADPSDVIRAEAPAVLRFLAEDWGFTGPELTDDGIAFHRSGLHVHMGFWSWKNESGFLTTLTQTGTDGTELRAGLGELYAACGVGTAHDVPEGAGTVYVIRKRIGQHATALRKLLPYFDDTDTDALFRSCSPSHGAQIS